MKNPEKIDFLTVALRGAMIPTLAAFLAVCSQGQTATAAKSPQVVPVSPDITWHAAGEIAIPFEFYRNHIYVSLSLNGKPGFIFMLDSGANRNILNLRTARGLGMRAGEVTQERNIGFGDAPIYTAPQENVTAEIASRPIAHSMSVMDLTRFEQHFGHRTDGMLGTPFFQHFVVNIDFQKKLMFIFPPDRFRYRGWGIQVPIRQNANFILLPVMVGGTRQRPHEVAVAVDTGSDVTLMLYEHFVGGLNLQESFQKSRPALAFGLNGYFPVQLGSVNTFLIGDAETHSVPVDYLADNEEVGSQHRLPGAIGMGVLRSFRAVIFDVPHQRMVLELKAPPLTTSRVLTVTY